jgi:macrolide transport system ATP-binding/permease protein
VLSHVQLDIAVGESLAIVGRSGSGKSTLLGILGLLDEPSTGTLEFDGSPVPAGDRARSRLRSQDFGFVFQRAHLIADLSAIENVLLGLRYAGFSERDAHARARDALMAVGLGHRIDAEARTLSGGEMQRVAIARTMARPARVWLADEPTGNLDTVQSAEIIDLLVASAERLGAALIVVTHEPEIAARLDREVRLQDGQIITDTALAPTDAVRSNPPPQQTVLHRVSHRWRFVAESIRAHRRRSWSGIAATALAVTLAIAALGLGQSAGTQVSDLFDGRRAREVSAVLDPVAGGSTVAEAGDGTGAAAAGPALDPDLLGVEGLSAYPGVASVSLWLKCDDVEVRNGAVADTSALVVAGTGATFEASRSQVDWAPFHPKSIGSGEVVLGTLLARRLHITQFDLQPEVVIAGESHRVVGILTSSGSGPASGAAFIAPASVPDQLRFVEAEVFVRTAPGAAASIAKRVGPLVDPYRTAQLTVAPVLRPDSYRDELEGSVQTSLGIVSAVAALAGLLVVVCVNVLNVSARKAEFGVRRAFGATRAGLAGMVLGECALLSAIGAVVGSVAGFLVVMGVTIWASWHPVFSPSLLLIGAAAAVCFGAVGGVGPAIAAGRTEPADAVRA